MYINHEGLTRSPRLDRSAFRAVRCAPERLRFPRSSATRRPCSPRTGCIPLAPVFQLHALVAPLSGEAASAYCFPGGCFNHPGNGLFFSVTQKAAAQSHRRSTRRLRPDRFPAERISAVPVSVPEERPTYTSFSESGSVVQPCTSI